MFKYMKQLFITDMDGTLLTSKCEVSEISARIISDLSQSGVGITVATARTPATVEPLMRNVHTFLPAIVMTGAAMWDRGLKRYVDPQYFSEELAFRCYEECRRSGVHPFVYRLEEESVLHLYFSDVLTEAETRFVAERNRTPYKRVHLLDKDVDDMHNALLFFAIGYEKDVVAAAERIKALGCAAVAYPDNYTPGIYFLEAFAPGVSKAAAVLRLKAMTGAERVTVFGDNLNDIPMMEIADTAVAVANAQPQVKAIAHEVISSNDTDAVARYIQNKAARISSDFMPLSPA